MADIWFEKRACELDPSRPKVSGMRHAKNFHPEWGFLAPAPSFMRTLRTVFVATAVGATAGGGLVLSLVDHSAGQTSASAGVRFAGPPLLCKSRADNVSLIAGLPVQ